MGANVIDRDTHVKVNRPALGSGADARAVLRAAQSWASQFRDESVALGCAMRLCRDHGVMLTREQARMLLRGTLPRMS